MSDDLDIRGGGAVAVDTATLRRAADGFTGLASDLTDVAGLVGSAGLRLFAATDAAYEVSSAIELVRRRILAVAEGAVDISAALRSAAAVYEIVELRTERAAAASAGDSAAVARIDARLGALGREFPEADGQATVGALAHWLSWPNGLAAQAPGVLWWLAPGMHAFAIPLAWSIQRAIGGAGAGTVASTSRLRGSTTAVIVSPVAARGATTAPTSLAEAAARIPTGGESRIRVERYTMQDGSHQFAVYVTGTETLLPQTREPFDMGSNVQLYTGERSASYDATVAALEQAGAQTGDVVHAFGHSQGGMVLSHVALEGGFDTRTLVTFGSPVEADVGPGTLSIALRHSDDPVAALAGGGHAGAVGAPGSFVAERTADPRPGLHDLALAVHGIEGYTRTAEVLDASGDARMTAVESVFDELRGAASVDVTEYSAMRVAPEPLPRPAVAPSSPISPSTSGGG
ncbi:hypothetical protein SAMN04487846_0170 [Microbacterium sp. cf046]|uniref:hypothetical protein n=1 Tax=Microbacterium sp. cf046 TaxID=1761803 RepID=UPI0008EC302E|nr:hypothetical protein [Microbacterium sp. cf046]SFR87544.1 hypothetical protein SAMN04487846_0170 [Microbacterium sp. cf046]